MLGVKGVLGMGLIEWWDGGVGSIRIEVWGVRKCQGWGSMGQWGSRGRSFQVTLRKHQKIHAIFGRSENMFQSFIMVVYETFFLIF